MDIPIKPRGSNTRATTSFYNVETHYAHDFVKRRHHMSGMVYDCFCEIYAFWGPKVASAQNLEKLISKPSEFTAAFGIACAINTNSFQYHLESKVKLLRLHVAIISGPATFIITST